MKNLFWFIIILILIRGGVFYLGRVSQNTPEDAIINQAATEVQEETRVIPASNEEIVGLANPASTYCIENGGQLEIITNADGGQFGLCQFADYACEEWAYYNGDCDLEADAQKISEALMQKGLNLEGMQVVIKTHLGDEIEAAVVPVSVPAGGGYVFAKKVAGEMEIVADGNGVIMCSSLTEYPDFSTYLIASCSEDSSGKLVLR